MTIAVPLLNIGDPEAIKFRIIPPLLVIHPNGLKLFECLLLHLRQKALILLRVKRQGVMVLQVFPAVQ